MRNPTFAAAARHPATGVAVLAIGVATSSWAIVHTAEQAARDSWNARTGDLIAPAGSPLDGISALPPVLATESLRTSSGWTLTVLAWLGICWVATAHPARSGRAWLSRSDRVRRGLEPGGASTRGPR